MVKELVHGSLIGWCPLGPELHVWAGRTPERFCKLRILGIIQDVIYALPSPLASMAWVDAAFAGCCSLHFKYIWQAKLISRPALGKVQRITKRDRSYLIVPQAGSRLHKRRNISLWRTDWHQSCPAHVKWAQQCCARSACIQNALEIICLTKILSSVHWQVVLTLLQGKWLSYSKCGCFGTRI